MSTMFSTSQENIIFSGLQGVNIEELVGIRAIFKEGEQRPSQFTLLRKSGETGEVEEIIVGAADPIVYFDLKLGAELFEKLKIEQEDTVRVMIPAYALYHIVSMHGGGAEASSDPGSSFSVNFLKLIESLRDQNFEVHSDSNSIGVTFDMERTVGQTGVVSLAKLIEKGVLTMEELQKKREALKDRWIDKSTAAEEGTSDGDKLSVSQVRTGLWAFTVKLADSGIRPEELDTSLVTLILRKGENPSYDFFVVTAFPGEWMPKIPGDPNLQELDREPAEHAWLNHAFVIR